MHNQHGRLPSVVNLTCKHQSSYLALDECFLLINNL